MVQHIGMVLLRLLMHLPEFLGADLIGVHLRILLCLRVVVLCEALLILPCHGGPLLGRRLFVVALCSLAHLLRGELLLQGIICLVCFLMGHCVSRAGVRMSGEALRQLL